MNPEITEKIESYLNDEMQPEERRDFELQLATDIELQKSFELYNSINKTMSATPNENELNETLQQMNRKYFAGGSKLRQGSYKKWKAAAAAVIVIDFGAVYFLSSGKPSAEKLYAEFAQPPALNIQMRGTATDSLAQNAAASFNKKEYNTAKPLLQQYVQLQPENMQMEFSLAVCYLETGNYSQAELAFSAIALTQSAYKETAKWWLALSSLKQNDYGKCRDALNLIPQTSPYYTRAKELLGKLPD